MGLILPRKNRLRFPRYVGFQPSSSDLSEYTFTGWVLKRGLHVICVAGSGSSSVSSVGVAVGGVSATVVAYDYDTVVAGVYTYVVPSDGTYSIVLTPSATGQRFGCAVYDCTGFNATPADTAIASSGGGTSRTATVDVPSNGVLIAAGALADSTVSHSFTAGISTTRVNTDMDTSDYALIGDTYPTTAESNRTVTITRGNSQQIRLATASFQP